MLVTPFQSASYTRSNLKEMGRGGREGNPRILTHGNTQQADSHLHARDDIERFENSVLYQPVVRAPGKAKTEHVLKHK